MYSMYCPNLSLQSGSLNKDSSGLRVKWSSQAAVFHHTGHWFSPTLEQLVNNEWQPLAYFSRAFSNPQRKYQAYDKELLAILEG